MTELIAPNLSLSYGWTPRSGGTPGDSGWGNPVSANFKKLDALVGLSVLSASVTAPIVTTDGTRYIVASSGATGAFAGKENQVAVRVAGVWEFYFPPRGLLAENQATGTVLKFNGTAWLDTADLISPNGNNLLPDTYSWLTSTVAPPLFVQAGLTVTAVAVVGAISGFGLRVVSTDNSSGRYFALAPINTAAGWNMALEPGTYIISFWASAAVAGTLLRTNLYDGTSRYSSNISISTTRTRYSMTIDVTAATLGELLIFPNMSALVGIDITLDSPMVSKRASVGSSVVPPPFVPGSSAARLTAATLVSALNVNNPGAATLVNGAGFTKIALGTVVEDTRSGWSVANNTYTPVESGMYLVQAMLRPVRVGTDNMPSGTNLKLGFGSTAADGIDVECDTSTDALPFTVSFCKPMRLVAGTPYFIFGNHTAVAPIAFTYGQLKITKIGA